MAKGKKAWGPVEFTALVFVLALVVVAIVQILNWIARWIGFILIGAELIGIIAIIGYIIRKRRSNGG